MAYTREIRRKDANGRMIRTGRWSAQIYLGKDPATGKTRWESKTFATRKAAKDWANKLEVQRTDGAYRPTVSKATFADYLLRTWLPSYRRRRPRSAYNTERTLTKWIITPNSDTPYLGKIPLRQLTVQHFDDLYAAMEEKHGMRARGVRHVHGLLRRVLTFAVIKHELPSNPTEGATVPSGKLGPVRYLTEDQETRFLAVARKDRLSALWHLLLDTGLRPGEAFALAWEGNADDTESWIDLKAKLVHVRTTLARVGVDKAEAGWKLTDPKTENSKRDVPICDDTVTELERWRTEQKKERLMAGPEWRAHGFVFTSQVGTPLGNNMRRVWGCLLKEADQGKGDLGTWGPEQKKPRTGPTPDRSFTPRFSVYVLRHTMATLNYLDGMDLGLLSRRLGHASYAFTFDRYGRGVKAEHTKAVADNTQRRWRAASSS
jgi:integrase